MQLIMVRHGKAESDAPTGRDGDRLLRSKGEQQARHVAESLAALPRPPVLILSSGIVRAVQTARILQQRIGCPLRIESALETGAAPSGVAHLIDRERTREGGEFRDGPMVIVGHNPTFEELAGLLTSGPAAPPVSMRTGEALMLEVPEPPAELVGACTLVESIRLDDE